MTRCSALMMAVCIAAMPLSLWGQASSRLDSLEQELSRQQGEARFALLLELATQYLRVDPAKAIPFAEDALSLGKTLRNPALQASVMETLGLLYEKQSRHSDALSLHREALDIRKNLGDSIGVAASLHHIGGVYLSQNRNAEALDHYLQALRIKERHHHRASMGVTLSNIGNIYYDLGDFNEALKYQKRAFELAKELDDKPGTAAALNNLANIYDEQNQLTEARACYEQALEICASLDDQVGISMLLNNLGYAEERIGNYAKALERYAASLRLKEKIGDKGSLAITLQSIAEFYENRGFYDKAIEFGKRALVAAREAEALRTVANVYELLARIEAKRGNYKAAFEHSQARLQARDSLLNEARARQLAEIQEKYESEKKQREIALLRQEKEIQALALAQETLLRNSLMGIALLALALAFTAYRGYRNKRKAEAILKEKNAALDAALVVAQRQREIAEEANRFKTELLSIAAHDLKNPLQSISGFAELTQEQLDALDAKNSTPLATAKQFLQRIGASAQRMSELISSLLQTAALDANTLLLNRQPTNLSELLARAISEAEAQAMRKSQTIRTYIQPNCVANVDANRISEVFENLISNAMKYSERGKTITVECRYVPAQLNGRADGKDGEAILIAFKDEGQGLSEEDKKKVFGKFQRLSARPTDGESSTGLGLSIVKQLVELHGGAVWVESEGKGKGAAFFVKLPVASAAAASGIDAQPARSDAAQ